MCRRFVLQRLSSLLAIILVTAQPVLAGEGKAVDTRIAAPVYGTMIEEYLPVAYSGTEKFVYAISWTGGVKLGELQLEIRSLENEPESYELFGLITTEGSFMNSIYPVHDRHSTKVRGKKRLPYHYEVWQEEGYGYEAHRVTEYDQEKGLIHYRKNDNPVVEYNVEGQMHNEFSAFFASRLMDFSIEKPILVPTFADKKKVDVEVKTLNYTTLKETVLGDVPVVQVTPILKFKGLYDKRGDTVIWYTDDACRVPVLINSKIAIGSVTAKLLSYENMACSLYGQGQKNMKDQ